MMFLLLFTCAIKTSQMQPGYEKKSNHIIEKAFIFFALLSEKH